MDIALGFDGGSKCRATMMMRETLVHLKSY